MKTILGSKLVKRDNISEETIIYVTENLKKDIERINKTSDMLWTSINIVNYMDALELNDEEAILEFKNKYGKDFNIDTYKKDAKELLKVINQVFNSDKKSEVVTSKVGFTTGEELNNKEENNTEAAHEEKVKSILDLINSDKMKEITKDKNSVLEFLNKVGNMKNIAIADDVIDRINKMESEEIGAYLDIVKATLKIKSACKEIIKDITMDDINKIKKILFEEKDDNKEPVVTSKVGFTTGEELMEQNKKTEEVLEKIEDSKTANDKKNTTGPILDINKINKAAEDMKENINKHITEMNTTNTEGGKDYTCNHCKDPKCTRKVGELSALCIHYADGRDDKQC